MIDEGKSAEPSNPEGHLVVPGEGSLGTKGHPGDGQSADGGEIPEEDK